MEVKTWNAYENRCDRCGAESWFHFERLTQVFEVTLHQDFYFCGHHGRKFEPALTEAGFEHTDHTDQINVEPSTSATAV